MIKECSHWQSFANQLEVSFWNAMSDSEHWWCNQLEQSSTCKWADAVTTKKWKKKNWSSWDPPSDTVGYCSRVGIPTSNQHYRDLAMCERPFRLNCELWEYSKQTFMRCAELSIFSGLYRQLIWEAVHVQGCIMFLLGFMYLDYCRYWDEGDYVTIGLYCNLPTRSSALCAEGASGPGVKLAQGAEGIQFTLHSLRGARFMLELNCLLWVSGVVHVVRGQGALTFNLRCIEVAGVPSSQLALTTRRPWPNQSDCPFCTKGPGGPSWGPSGQLVMCVLKGLRGPSDHHVLYVPRGLGALVINLQHMRWRAWGP